MNASRSLPWIIALLFVVAMSACAEDAATEIQCLKSQAFFAPPDSPDYLKYAPDRDVRIVHLALDVTPDFKQRTIEGTAVTRFQPIVKPVQELRFDAVDLDVHSVTSTEKIQAYQVTDKQITVTFADPIPPDREASVSVTYHAEPKQGLYFRTPEMGYQQGDTHLFSQGEEIEARHWYPCFDSPNEKFTSEITCHVPAGMTVLSNGRLVSEQRDPATGLVAVHWSQDKPHANYLITLVAGYFRKVEDKYQAVPLAFYTPPSEFNQASNSFRDTRDIMAFYEEEIGVPYPWDKYDQVCVNDFVAGGMENTSCTTLTDGTLFAPDTENIRDSRSLVAHEMAHQWFGDLVTCRDWSQIWLNEGFATYYESLYEAHKNGRDAMLYELYQRARQITGMPNDTNAIVRRDYNRPGDMFNYLAYPKGGWVLHMLRSQLGDDLYRRCIKTYLQRHEYGNVTTEDLREVIEELSGHSFDQFFNQWVYHAHHPELEINYSWDQTTKLAKVSLRQVQKLSDNVLLFNFPLPLRFKGRFGTVDRSIQVKNQEEDFYFPLDEAPEIVRLDPKYTLLARITFNVPRAMLDAELADQTDLIGRLLAIEQLRTKTDHAAVAHLKQALNSDRFYGVRIQASQALRSIHSEEAIDALLASTQQDDARVRLEVASDIGDFYTSSAYDFASKALQTEKNPAILSEDIRALGGYARPEVREALLHYLDSESYREELAAAAIAAMRLQDDPAYVAPLREALVKREAEFPGRVFAQGLGTLAYLARNEESKTEVREFLTRSVDEKRERVQLAALTALGTLGDPKAISVLEKFASASEENRQQAAARSAVEILRAGRKPVDDFKNLRRDVLDLQKQNRELRKDLDALKKQFEAAAEASPEKKTSPVLASPKARARH